jgi:hypothetical protein
MLYKSGDDLCANMYYVKPAVVPRDTPKEMPQNLSKMGMVYQLHTLGRLPKVC